MRLAFAVAAHLEPEILVVDEVLAVGDAQFQKKCLGKMQDVAALGRTILLVSHNMHVIRNLCSAAFCSIGAQSGTSARVRKSCGTTSNSSNTSPVLLSFDVHEAPASKTMRLIQVRILNSRGENAAVVEIDKEIGIEFTYDVLCDIARGYAALWLKDSSGTEVLASANIPYMSAIHDEFCGKPLKEGRYRTICRIPPNFLNAGPYLITPIFPDWTCPTPRCFCGMCLPLRWRTQATCAGNTREGGSVWSVPDFPGPPNVWNWLAYEALSWR